MSQASSIATTHKIYLMLLSRSNAFHWRQNHFKILLHTKTSREGLHQPPPPLYHGGGMNLHVSQRFKSVENKSEGKGLVFFLKKWSPRFHVLEVGSHVPSCQYFTGLSSTCLHHCLCFNPIFASFLAFHLSHVPVSRPCCLSEFYCSRILQYYCIFDINFLIQSSFWSLLYKSEIIQL